MGKPTTATMRRIHVLRGINIKSIAGLVILMSVACFCGCTEEAPPTPDAAPPPTGEAINKTKYIVTPPPPPNSQPSAK